MSSEVTHNDKDSQAAAANDKETKYAGQDLSSAGEESVESTKEVRPIHGWQWVSVVASLYSFALLYGLDTTVSCLSAASPRGTSRLQFMLKLSTTVLA
jgi:hypothetical protein